MHCVLCVLPETEKVNILTEVFLQFWFFCCFPQAAAEYNNVVCMLLLFLVFGF